MQDVGIKQNSDRIVGISSAKYGVLLTDIADFGSLKNKKEDKKEIDVVVSEKSSSSTDEYIKNLLEFTNLKSKEIVIIEEVPMKSAESTVASRRTLLGDTNCTMSYSDIMSNGASDDLDWND